MKSPIIGFVFDVEEESNHLFKAVNEENFLEHFSYDFGSIRTKKGLVFDFFQHTMFIKNLTNDRKKREVYIQQYEPNIEFMIGEMGQEKFDKLWFETTIDNMKDDSLEEMYLEVYKEDATEEPLKLKLKMAYISDQEEGKETLLDFSSLESFN